MEQNLPLKDIHLPEAIGWWPPAPGWWLLPLLLALVIFAAWRLYKRLTRRTALKTAKRTLDEIRKDTLADQSEKLRRLSELLRRTAISLNSREQCAGLTGEAWLRYLDRSVKGAPFSSGAGRCLGDAQYGRTPPGLINLQALFNLCEQWLKGQKG